MNKAQTIMALYAIAMTGLQNRIIPVRKNDYAPKKKEKPIPKGCQKYTFGNGEFECVARTQKSAEKKWERYKQANGLK